MSPSKNPSGLGRAIINRKAKESRRTAGSDSNLYTVDSDSSKNLKSVTEETDLSEFLSTAQLAGTDFLAEKQNVTVIRNPMSAVPSTRNLYLLSPQEEQEALQRQDLNKGRLRVPRRPNWTKTTPVPDLDRREREAFLDWRRSLAGLQEDENFVLTPFEKNLEVWRQLWRVIERSQLVVQIVDARNPLRFRCEDLERYVYELEGPEGESGTGPGERKSILLINKADLLTASQRRFWADYFDSQKVIYAFYSAARASSTEGHEPMATGQTHFDDGENQNIHRETDDEHFPGVNSSHDGQAQDLIRERDAYIAQSLLDDGAGDSRIMILSVSELEELFMKTAQDLTVLTRYPEGVVPPLVVGLVGYPNVGKSSTINSLIGAKKVSVSSTPGKTKHFQTIYLTPSLILCDCPGLVFPQFATTKADLVCDGVLPIDQMREYSAPISLLVQRIPAEILELTYGLTLYSHAEHEDGSESISGEDLLMAYAIARGFARSGQGNPDEARAARYILKDYVNAKLLYCHPPPGISAYEFNEPTRTSVIQYLKLLGKKKAPISRVVKGANTYVPPLDLSPGLRSAVILDTTDSEKMGLLDTSRTNVVQQTPTISDLRVSDSRPQNKQQFARVQDFPHQRMTADDGTRLDAPRPTTGDAHMVGKKHHKRKPRTKQRSGSGYE